MELTFQIELLRNKMIRVGISKGLTASETIKLSEALDSLICLQLKMDCSFPSL
ncbi:aspartyl-phosphate phosphatase Spo0E family protein [Neobacillus dielmonensis]|uniref:aspartyl-phosphate phosphatase Spo0E family protein n=1 Tax=Neobacillus dielmonensis TaxID=1347369 RepID=UPI0038737976